MERTGQNPERFPNQAYVGELMSLVDDHVNQHHARFSEGEQGVYLSTDEDGQQLQVRLNQIPSEQSRDGKIATINTNGLEKGCSTNEITHYHLYRAGSRINIERFLPRPDASEIEVDEGLDANSHIRQLTEKLRNIGDTALKQERELGLTYVEEEELQKLIALLKSSEKWDYNKAQGSVSTNVKNSLVRKIVSFLN